jgi:hypothetical protein
MVVVGCSARNGGMNTNESHQVADNAKRIETWEQLRERLFRLAELGEELSAVVSGPVTTWLYREIETEAARVAEVAGAYIDECERLDRAPQGGDRPAWRAAPLPPDEASELVGRRLDRRGAGGGRR